MIRVHGHTVFFYSHRFSPALLESIANGTEPLEYSQINKFGMVINDVVVNGLSLLNSRERVTIFQILDAIQQTIANM